ncbi:dicarboxylate/amino acid:cation symporter [Allokutzneria sp. A3M-2-11 16]|uniref:dicarboxylate/amino acid:cation symporter n=1 Tax=Allokutzneria sp. A3M-2-11 16 TaxID=2962043 RepID=UPI0020B6973A|nr:dicarboxylate/amino acid:cation symporter [Allokutzneria sp. A3M-2-11 16]MCP3800443.1 dicarboxylate/amino acid:cation symporter [Allokutzneria sp. A3M-2-11 16]
MLKKIPFWVQIVAGLVLGIALGVIARVGDLTWLGTALSTIGGTFVQLLMLAVVPLVFTAIVVSIANLRHINGGPGTVARLTGKTLLWFGITSLIAVLVGIATGLVSNPGQGVALTPDTGYTPKTQGSWLDFLKGIIPSNPVDAFTSNGKVLQIVFLAVVIGIAAYKVGEKAEPFVAFNRSLLEVVQKALWWVIRLAPLGTLGLIGKAASQYGFDLLRPLATFVIGVYVACAVVLFVVYPVLLRVVGKVSPAKFFANAWPAIQLAFVSRSSIGTLPLTQRTTIDNLGVPREYASFAVPFGASTKMDGCAAVYPAIAAIFVSQVFNVPLSLWDYVLIAFVSVVGSAATAGLTGATVMLTLTLSTVGLPLAGVGLLLAIDPILDMMRTATNVAGQMVVPVLVARSEGTLDDEVYNAPRTDVLDSDSDSEPVPA